MIEREQVELELQPGMLNVITLEVRLRRTKNGESSEVVQNYLCHYWILHGPEQRDLDLYRVQDGRLHNVATICSVESVMEE